MANIMVRETVKREAKWGGGFCDNEILYTTNDDHNAWCARKLCLLPKIAGKWEGFQFMQRWANDAQRRRKGCLGKMEELALLG